MRPGLLAALVLAALPARAEDRVVRLSVVGDAVIGTVRPAAGAGPGVLMLHDLAGARADFDALAARLSAAGIPSFRIDFRGSGDSRETPWAETTISGQVLDARAALAWMVGQPDFADRPLAVLGHGHGALVATLMLDDLPRPAALVHLDPVTGPVAEYRAVFGPDLVDGARAMPQTRPVAVTLATGEMRELNALFFYELGWVDLGAVLRRPGPPILTLGPDASDGLDALVAGWLHGL